MTTTTLEHDIRSHLREGGWTPSDVTIRELARACRDASAGVATDRQWFYIDTWDLHGFVEKGQENRSKEQE